MIRFNYEINNPGLAPIPEPVTGAFVELLSRIFRTCAYHYDPSEDEESSAVADEGTLASMEELRVFLDIKGHRLAFMTSPGPSQSFPINPREVSAFSFSNHFDKFLELVRQSR